MCSVKFPASFNPDGSGKQTSFRPLILDASGPVFFNMVIADPKGKVVYETYCAENCWDGCFNGSPCPAGEYHYQASLLESEKDPSLQITSRGIVRLLRAN